MKKKIEVILMTMVMAVSVLFVGCNKPPIADGNQDLQIYVLKQGYGAEWLTKTVEMFKEEAWVKEKYPQLNILPLAVNTNVGFAGNQMANPENNTYDILCATNAERKYFSTNKVEDLTESVYNQLVPGENVYYKDKINESLKAALADTDKNGNVAYKATPYFSGNYGFIYNADAIKKYMKETYGSERENSVPRTTDEFIAICEKIFEINCPTGYTENAPQYAFIQSSNEDYWQKEGSTFEAWWAQYNGPKGYDNFFNGVNNDEVYSVSSIFEQQGRLESLKVIEKLLHKTNEKDYFWKQGLSNNSSVSQVAFLKGKSVFHYSGDYFVYEMKEAVDKIVADGGSIPTIKMMRTPIISAITNECPSIKGDATMTADEELSNVVESIDNETELAAILAEIKSGKKTIQKAGKYDVEAEDFQMILEARGVVNSVGPAPCIIPSYSNAKEIAIDFLRFMATDKAIIEYAKGTQGSTLDFMFDMQAAAPDVYETLAPLHKDRLAYMNSKNIPITILKKGSTYPLGMWGALKPIVVDKYYFEFRNDNSTAQTIFDNTKTAWGYNKDNGSWDSAKFDAALSAAGL